MACPNADGAIRPVLAHSRSGVPIRLDQCDHCGGLWFDRFELFQVDEAEAGTLDRVDKPGLRFPAGGSEKPLCPRCRLPLRVFTDSNIPNNIQLLMCDKCEGFWVNHGVLAGYARFREAGHKRPDSELAAQYEALAEQYEKQLKNTSNKEYWQALERWGNEMGGQRDFLTGMRLDGSPAELERIDRAQDFFYTALGAAARLLFGWL